MQSSFGWLELSSASLARLQRELQDGDKGVVDEMGMLGIHGAYADHFFPGTSVLHTRARYLLFEPWNFLCASNEPNLRARMRDLHLWLADRLLDTTPGVQGVIGRTLLPNRVPAQPPDFIYWTAMTEYRLYEGPTRGQVYSRWEELFVAHQTWSPDPAVPKEDVVRFNVPKLPANWGRLRQVTFDLTREEAAFLVRQLAATKSLLGAIAERLNPELPPLSALVPWEEPLVETAANNLDEWARLQRARGASALAHLVRGIYAALVERRRNLETPQDSEAYAETLMHLCFDRSEPTTILETARDVDLDGLVRDGVPGSLKPLLEDAVAALRALGKPGDVRRLLNAPAIEELFRKVEVARKGAKRARLAVTSAELRRQFGDTTVSVYALDYRWKQVRQMLNDIREGLGR